MIYASLSDVSGLKNVLPAPLLRAIESARQLDLARLGTGTLRPGR